MPTGFETYDTHNMAFWLMGREARDDLAVAPISVLTMPFGKAAVSELGRVAFRSGTEQRQSILLQ